ncbi:MAG TPA: magnesium transporter [Chitinophagaceae bacterium]|nr:magnesium transporter [Chitinophagaceae bacterium]
MSEELEHIDLKQQFEELIGSNDQLSIREFLNDQNISDVAFLINEYPEYEAQIITNLSIHRAASTFKILDLSVQKRVIQELPPIKTAELLNDLPPDDRTDFLEELPSEVVKELIRLLNAEERKITLSLLGYPESSVGRLMTPDYIAVQIDWTVQEVLDYIREVGKQMETIDVIYVVNDKGEFVDDMRIRDLILASPDKLVGDIIDHRSITLHVNDDQEVATQVFKMNHRIALPVIDDKNILLGIVTIDDVLWVANEEFTEDIQKIGGTEALDEPYLEMPIFKLFRKRVVWLIVLFLGEMLTATVMAYFEDELAKYVVLALFVPLIISSGGNTGSQASTLIIQAMALGEITIHDWWRVMRRELISGFLLGTVLGLIGFVRVAFWNSIFHTYGDHGTMVAFTVGFSLLGVVLWGTVTGSMLPIIMKKLGTDPATSSAPFVATLVDVTGLVIYFSMAFLFMQDILG